ncbi:MAG: hypothetical protein KC609_01905 [Myxococcales bacterium]|nr:hypothetical protein [Myxococcales bacterium]
MLLATIALVGLGCNARPPTPEATFRHVFSALVQNPGSAAKARAYFSERWREADKAAYAKMIASLPKGVKLKGKSSFVAAFSLVGERILSIDTESLGSTKKRLRVRFIAGQATILMTLEKGRWRIDAIEK